MKFNNGDIIKLKIDAARQEAKSGNLFKVFSNQMIELFRSPDSKEKYLISDNGDQLFSKNGHPTAIINGIPDFTIFSLDEWDEKEKQIRFHDNEKLNETFAEIVLRPFNSNSLNTKVWQRQLFILQTELLKFKKKPIEGDLILSCGCGGGFEAQFFAKMGAKIVGFDISQLRVEAAATRFTLNKLDGFFYRGDSTIIPFGDNTFDIVLYHDSLHHVPIEEIPKALKEACRVTKQYVILLEAHDSLLRLFLENFGLSTSVEASGNYTFRFRRSLIQFWCDRFNMKMLLYKTRLMYLEHRPKIYSIPVLGYMFYYLILILGVFLKPIGNQAFIILEKNK